MLLPKKIDLRAEKSHLRVAKLMLRLKKSHLRVAKTLLRLLILRSAIMPYGAVFRQLPSRFRARPSLAGQDVRQWC